ncbi:hypothetical protein [Marinomonas transparens]|uniref:Uncharacterized protein n=1 Tax=Marinomonas transparens TaxID=2795388 RepID=A0A934JY72_9GAMM|nr:hypothetical protein [Marinomonas transparens]MBJ7539359.1 hypothetical protein [Marinomonas transparens]
MFFNKKLAELLDFVLFIGRVRAEPLRMKSSLTNLRNNHAHTIQIGQGLVVVTQLKSTHLNLEDSVKTQAKFENTQTNNRKSYISDVSVPNYSDTLIFSLLNTSFPNSVDELLNISTDEVFLFNSTGSAA